MALLVNKYRFKFSKPLLKTSRAVGEKEKYTNFAHAKEKREIVVTLMFNKSYCFRACSEFTAGLQFASKMSHY